MRRKIDRRRFVIATSAAVGALSLAAPAVIGRARPRLMVIGGGAGGATAAKYVARDSGGAVDVTLVEPARHYTTCFHSNFYLAGLKPFEGITHGYDRLAGYGVRVAHQVARAIDRDRRRVRLADGTDLAYDRLVVAPGIELDYDSVPGWGRAHEERMPHAWRAGRQTRILKAQLDAVPAGGLIVVIPPPNPYRCPPGPYERVSMMAHLLKFTGRGNCRIVIVDPKDKFSKQGLFQPGWERYYPGMVEWLDPTIHEGVKSVDPATNSVVTGFETYRNCALVNVIPAQKAGRIAREAGLADASGFCPIRADSMQSAIDPDVYVLGDSAIAGAMPKSAVAANSQAKVAAAHLRSTLTGSPAAPAHYTNTCWSQIEIDDAVKVGARYEPRDGRITTVEDFISHPDDSATQRSRNQDENLAWYDDITEDIFG